MNIRQVWDDGRAVIAARWFLRPATALGGRVRLRGWPRIDNQGRMIIGQRVQLVSRPVRLELVALRGGTLEIGERTLVNYGGSICAAASVRIGAR
jgi:adhesin HecA-like repeat protein